MRLLIFTFIIWGTAVSAQQGPQIVFENNEYNFGDIVQGDTVSYKFTFTNSGDVPLILENVITTCGCTATKWPRDPVAPGKTAEIVVNFDSKTKYGIQRKIIRVRSNATTPEYLLYLSGNVLPSNNPYH